MPNDPLSQHARHLALAALAALAAIAALDATLAAPALAADVVVRVTGMSEPFGQIGCSLFADAKGFPMDSSAARATWLASDAGGVTCRFSGVGEGTYAVSVAHDLNGNRKVDTNFVGFPTEQWGVSNNVRPTLRAPRFEEAAFKVGADAKEIVVDIKVAK